MDKIILVANPGSASRKYSIFRGGRIAGDLHFEFERHQIVCTIKIGGQSQKFKTGVSDFGSAIKLLLNIAYRTKLLNPSEKISAIGIRIVAPGDFFTGDHLVNHTFLKELEQVRLSAPLHIDSAIKEIYELQKLFRNTKIIAISDSAFHRNMPEVYKDYGISTDLANKFNIKRYGYHGISLAAVIDKLLQERRYRKFRKIVVAHLGSGCSVTAINNWQSVNTSMGYSPLEGLMSATRSGSIDLAAAFKIKRSLGLSDSQMEAYFNKESGLLAVSKKSDDLRELLKLERKGDEKASLAVEIWISRIVMEIAKMITCIEGCDALVFTGTIGQRSAILRRRILEKLKFLGFYLNNRKNGSTINPQKIIDVSSRRGVIVLVVPTDENLEIVKRVEKFLS